MPVAACARPTDSGVPRKDNTRAYYCLNCHHAATLEDKDTIQCERCHYSVFYKRNTKHSHVILTD